MRAQGGSQARSRATEKEMPRETLERIAAQLGSLDGEPLQVTASPYTPIGLFIATALRLDLVPGDLRPLQLVLSSGNAIRR